MRREDDIQDPVITMMERYGGPMEEDEGPICPVCGETCSDFYMDEAHNIIGCDCCVSRVDAWDHRRWRD